MMIPPSSIPSAAAGRFTAPAEGWSLQGGPACPEPLHGQGTALWAPQELGEPTDPAVVQDRRWGATAQQSHQQPQSEPLIQK